MYQQYSVAAALLNGAAIELVLGAPVCGHVNLSSYQLYVSAAYTRVKNELLVNVRLFPTRVLKDIGC